MICCGINKQEILEYVEPALIEQYQSGVDNNGYNIVRNVRSNYNFSPEARQKMGRDMTGDKNSFFGKKHTEETRRRMSALKKGKSTWNKGKYGVQLCSEETRRKMSESQKRSNLIHPEKNIKRAEKCRDRKHDLETIKRMTELRHQRGPVNEESRQRMSDAKKGCKLSDATKEKMRLAQQTRRLKESKCL